MHSAEKALVRRFVRGQEAAAKRSLAALRTAPLSPTASLRAALELIDLAEPDSLTAPDRVREREVLAARRAWAKLRARLG
jgi:hypothetical protein